MKNILYLFLAVTIFACSSDDSNDDNNDDNNQFSGENISKIEIKILNNSDCYSVYSSINYESNIDFNYSGNIIPLVTYNVNYIHCETNEPISMSFERWITDDMYNTFQYENGYLTYIYWNDETEINYDWINGNRTRRYKSSNPSNYYQIEYSEHLNSTKYEFGSFFEAELMYAEMIVKDEFRGVTSANLPASLTYIQLSDDGTISYEDKDVYYNYEFNDEGKPIKFLVDSSLQEGQIYQVEITYTN